MRPLYMLMMVASLTIAGFALTLHAGVSNTSIGAGRTFMLGGGQQLPLRIEARNDSRATVEILLLADGKETAVGILKPGKSASLQLPRKTTALLRNTSKITATVHITGRIGGLSMSYENGDGL